MLDTPFGMLARGRGAGRVADGRGSGRGRRDVRRLVEEAVADYDSRSLSGGLPPLHDVSAAITSVHDVVAGLGPLQQYLDDPRVEEVWINERLPQWSARALSPAFPEACPTR